MAISTCMNTNKLQIFQIILDRPSKCFYPGEAVTGRVAVKCNGDLTAKALRLVFQAQAVVSWTEGRKQHSSTQTFCEFSTNLIGDGFTTIIIPHGISMYPFHFQFPRDGLPCSYEIPYAHEGKIKYSLEARISRPMYPFDSKVKESLILLPLLDLNALSGIEHPREEKKSKSFGCMWLCFCDTEPLTIKARVGKSGYVPGEVIDLQVKVSNMTISRVSDVIVELVEITTIATDVAEKRLLTPFDNTKQSLGQGVDTGDEDVFTVAVPIPRQALAPTDLGGRRACCGAISLEYALRVKVCLMRGLKSTKLMVPIIIGTIPLREEDADEEKNEEYSDTE